MDPTPGVQSTLVMALGAKQLPPHEASLLLPDNLSEPLSPAERGRLLTYIFRFITAATRGGGSLFPFYRWGK